MNYCYSICLLTCLILAGCGDTADEPPTMIAPSTTGSTTSSSITTGTDSSKPLLTWFNTTMTFSGSSSPVGEAVTNGVNCAIFYGAEGLNFERIQVHIEWPPQTPSNQLIAYAEFPDLIFDEQIGPSASPIDGTFEVKGGFGPGSQGELGVRLSNPGFANNMILNVEIGVTHSGPIGEVDVMRCDPSS